MVFTSCMTLQGKVVAVDHHPQSCRVTIQLVGTPEPDGRNHEGSDGGVGDC